MLAGIVFYVFWQNPFQFKNSTANLFIMKKFQVIFYGIFILGFVLKFFHIHFNAVIMLIGLGGILITSIISLFNKEVRATALLHFALFAWLLQLLITIKFFPFEHIALIIAAALSLVVIFEIVKKQQFKNFIPLVICTAVALSFYFMRTDNRYYLLNVKWNYEIEDDFITLDKYSWFLYKNGEVDKAQEISNQALEIALKTDHVDQIKLIEQHNELIRDNNWNSYR